MSKIQQLSTQLNLHHQERNNCHQNNCIGPQTEGPKHVLATSRAAPDKPVYVYAVVVLLARVKLNKIHAAKS